MSCFSRQFFLVVVEGGGGSWYFAHGCGLCNERGGTEKNTPNNRGRASKNVREKILNHHSPPFR